MIRLSKAGATALLLLVVILGMLSTPGCAPSPQAKTAALAAPDAIPPLARMCLEEKVGQLFMVGAFGEFMNQDSPALVDLRHQVVDNHVGGVIWFRSNVLTAAVLGGELDRLARIPLLFASDFESGPGMRFEDVTSGPWAMAIAATGDPALAERRGRATAEQARALGIAQTLGPVADVNVDPDNTVINTRSYGEDPDDVARFVAADVRGLTAGGVLATLKHFPGHGDTAVDSHLSLPTMKVDRARLERVELVPFRAGLAAGARAVMVAHIAVPALDPTPLPDRADALTSGSPTGATLPSTMSAPIVEGLLRGELKFDGLVVSDALDMGALEEHFEPGEAAVRAVLAGVDLLVKPRFPDLAIGGVLAAVRSGRIPVERLDRSVLRILAEKRRLGLTKPYVPDLPGILRTVDTPAYRALADEIAARSLTLVREETGVLPLDAALHVLHVVIADEATLSGPAGPLTAELARRSSGPTQHLAVTLRLDPRSTPVEVAEILEASRDADLILVSFFVKARSGSGRIAVPEPARDALPALLELRKPIVAVSFGSPYLLREFPELQTYVCAYGSQEVAQLAAARALFGEAAFEGHLPVTIPGAAQRGAGIERPASRSVQ
jgi:beta-N-acetylhexosaminidase